MSVDIEPWGAWSPDEIAVRLRWLGHRWAVAGGWALELFAGSVNRAHDDLEIVIAEADFAAVKRILVELEWFAVGDGNVAALEQNPTDQLLQTWQTWGWDQGACCWRIDVIREPWAGHDWVYRRDPQIRRALDGAIATSAGGVPYLAPEIVLLFKAKRQRPKDELDFSRTLPLLNSEQRQWLINALGVERPGHPWLTELR
jgi:hypothetical protein